MKQSMLKFSLTIIVFLMIGAKSNSQPIPEDFKQSTVGEQLQYVEAHTMIYQNFRAIREDVFQYIKKSVNDTLALTKKKITELNTEVASLKTSIDQINKDLAEAQSKLETVTNSKNSISFLGIEIQKSVYNSVMWSIIGIIVLLFLIGYYLYKKNLNVTIKARQELSEVQKEYEDYKQRKRVEHEKMTMSHFKEVKKLKEELSGRK